MSETRTYDGSCHCGAVRYQVTTDMAQVITCNCSYCSRRGSVLTFVTPDRFTLQSGGNDLVEYRFNTNRIQHLFCPTCGMEPFARGRKPDGTEMVAINIRCLEGVDLSTLTPIPFDGRSR